MLLKAACNPSLSPVAKASFPRGGLLSQGKNNQWFTLSQEPYSLLPCFYYELDPAQRELLQGRSFVISTAAILNAPILCDIGIVLPGVKTGHDFLEVRTLRCVYRSQHRWLERLLDTSTIDSFDGGKILLLQNLRVPL